MRDLRLFPAVIISGLLCVTNKALSAANYEFATGSTPTAVTPGLADSVYHLGQNQSFDYNASDAGITSVVNFAAANQPSYVFQNTADTFLYNSAFTSPGDELPTNAFLGADAVGAAATDTTPIETSIFDAKGLLHITTPGIYTIDSSVADDAVRVYIGGNGATGSGTPVFERNYNFFSNPPTVYTGPETVEFESAGWFPFEAFYYNEYSGGSGAADLELSITPAAGLAPVTFGTAVPEPASISLVVFGTAASLSRRKRQI